MAISIYHRQTCRLCGSYALNTALILKPTPLEDDFLPREKAEVSLQRFPLEVVLCESCGHAQLSHVISSNNIYDHYLYQTQTSPSLIAHFEAVCAHIVKKINLSPISTVLDIGCNDGAVLEFFRQHSMKVIGVEPSSVANVARNKEIPVYQAYFDDLTAKEIMKHYGYMSLITANNIFANVDDLDAFVSAVKILMKPDSVFIVETGYLKPLIENGVFDFIYHEHLSYFSIKALRQFFDKHDMHLYDVELVETKGGSARLFAQLKQGERAESSAVSQLIQSEEAYGLFGLDLYKNFYERILNSKRECHRLLDGLKIPKQFLAGYGASHSVTTLLHFFELGDRISFLVDDNTLKHNTLSPGYHLPVYDSEAIYKNSIKYALILPWRFSKNIISKHLKFMQIGGRFLEVYPTPAIVDF